MPDQGPSRGEYHICRSHRGYHDTLQGGTTRTSYGGSHGGMYPQAIQSSSLQPGTPAYDTASHALQRPPMGPRPPTRFVPIYSVQPADSPHSPGFVRQQIPRQMDLAWPSSQGSAGAWNPSAGLNSHLSTRASESHFSYNYGGFQIVRQQNPRPIAAPRPPQGPVGVVFPQVYLDFTFTPAFY